jgi:iron complex transport system ATP-binding protein
MQLKAEKLNIGYGNDKVVFGNISLVAAEGDMIALLGVNGIGKSTLLRTMAGLQKSVSGHLFVNGTDLQLLSVTERAKQVSIVLTERIYIDNITVHSFIALGRAPYTSWLGQLSDDDEREIEQVITVMKIESLLPKMFNELSDGERQKVLIARALCQQTPLIILDEPTAFLDFRNKRAILSTLKQVCTELNKTVVLSTHDIETALEFCNKCWIMTEQREFCEVLSSDKYEAEVKKILNY